MATYSVSGVGTSGHPSSLPTVKVLSQIISFSDTTNVANDVFEVLSLPANTLVLYAGLDILTADSAGNSGTLSLGDGDDVDCFVSASTPTAGIETTRARAGDSSKGTTSIGYRYCASAETIDLVVASGAINAVVRVFAVTADCDGHGDSETQKVTYE